MGRRTYIETNTIVKWCCGTKWFDHKWLASVCVTQAHLIGPKIVTAVYLVRWVSVAVGTLTYGDADVFWTEHVYWNHVVWLTVGCVVHLRDEPMCTWHDIQYVMLFNWSGNLGRLTFWRVTADRWLRATCTPSSTRLIYKKEKKTSSSSIMWHRYAKRTIGWLCPSSSRCKEVQCRLQRDRGRTLGTMCTCEEKESGTHACKAKAGPRRTMEHSGW